ncbi:MAG: TAXI family TRAP transporter solute-binding subunit [Acidaminococcales bacterium]|jgi:TRAP transporter TAXI family solute receptor|nr:TAXI family TRAP transporter solute-binding subunit [Acidaminococcales bacterium]
MRKKTCFFIFLLLAALLAGCGNAQRRSAVVPVKQQFISMASGGAADMPLRFSGVLADILNRDIPGMNVSVESTEGSAAGIALLAGGKADLAIAQSDVAHYAVNGTEMFQGGKVGILRGICALYPVTLHIAALERSGIKKAGDIRGRRVAAVTDAGVAALDVLAACGVPEKSVKMQYLDYNGAVKALTEGKADVMFFNAACPSALLKETALKERIVFIPLDDGEISGLLNKHPFYKRQVIPAGTYAAQTRPVTALSVVSVLLASDRISDEMGYKIVKAMYGDLQKLRGVHPAANGISKANAFAGVAAPFNAGAEKFLKE